MPILFLNLSGLVKAAGLRATLNPIPFVAPFGGAILFFSARLLREAVDGIGDFLGIGKSDWRF